MFRRYKDLLPAFPPLKLGFFHAVQEKIAEGYTLSDLQADIMSGLVVGAVAIPLGMALAIASGVAPQYGLYTVIVGGALVALLGGSRYQVTGPTAAFVVILAPIAAKYGFSGLLLAGLMAGVMLVAMGVAGLGQLIQFIPYTVTTGFTAGIAVVIATIQLKDFFGLNVEHMPESFVEKVEALLAAASTFSPSEFAVGVVTLFLLLFIPRVIRRMPAPIIVITLVTFGTFVLSQFISGFSVATISSRFIYTIDGVAMSGIPSALPSFRMPWIEEGSGAFITFGAIRDLVPSAFAIAMLGAIESLLSAVIADGMTQTRHNPDAELLALGVGNIICPFFGGIAATGAIARTATNIRFGARSPFSAVFHSIFTLLAVVLFAQFVGYVPMAAMAALLLVVAYNMADLKHFGHIINVAQRGDVAALLICFFLTVMFDMVVGVTVGVGLASLIFMRRMANITSASILTGGQAHHLHGAGEDTVVYEIRGPLFFGAAQRATEAMGAISDKGRKVVFDMSYVPMMDTTGLVAFESSITNLCASGKQVYMLGLADQPRQMISRSISLKEGENYRIITSLADLIE